MRAVTIEGFGELAAHLSRGRLAAPAPPPILRAACRAYLEFATARPALYQASSSCRPT
ncbi:hypothetical protein ACIQ9Q_36760 [Streptomyces sp. NPDC094438]|uniref:hypothetical protein n=1 Tax=Streptomyces sp. NPDC094438 TaxID=3366061 RepID=UPI0037FB59FB